MESEINQESRSSEVSDDELLKVMSDFLEMGYVDNIVAMFKQEPRYYQWVGQLLEDERFAVRLGVSVLFEYLVADHPTDVHLAVPSLKKALQHQTAWVRGEAASVLAIIATDEAIDLVKTVVDDPAPEVAAVARDILSEENE
ncbi:MAG: HEAT repeat domain-containing protein [Thermodesulfobacteriota bacterium]|nr:HEAT repeat domain-containing protein [Thermodesulfobacteriota bacterium]